MGQPSRPRPDFAIRALPLGFVVVDAQGKYVSRVFASHNSAAGAMTRARRVAGKVVRPCMCCAREFASEGVHNRLCENCRRGENLNAYSIGRRN